jgi:hypothetical protein
MKEKKERKTKERVIKEIEVIIKGSGKYATRYVLKGHQAGELSAVIAWAQLHVFLLDMFWVIRPYTLLIIWLSSDNLDIHKLIKLLEALIQ